MIASMWIGKLLLVVLNLPLIRIWVLLLKLPYRLLFPTILVLCCIGIYTLNNSATEVALAALFGLLGYLFIKLGCEPAPLLLAMVLGPMMEDELRRGMTINRGDATVFLRSPFSPRNAAPRRRSADRHRGPGGAAQTRGSLSGSLRNAMTQFTGIFRTLRNACRCWRVTWWQARSRSRRKPDCACCSKAEMRSMQRSRPRSH
jgi:hypothetical protein